MKRLFLTLFFVLFLVNGDIEIERSPTYFRDQLEVSQVAEIPIVDFKKLQEEFLEHKELYAKFFILKAQDEIKTLQDKKQEEIKRKLLKDKDILEDFLNGPIGIKDLEEGEEHTIVSLTSWPPRIHTVFLTIESLLRQSHKAHKVLLYLSEAEFPTKELPETLKFQQTRGLEVRWVKENLRSYKKLLYALKEFPTSNIITVDDDCFYIKHLISNFLEGRRNGGSYFFCYAEPLVVNSYGQICLKNENKKFAKKVTQTPNGVDSIFYTPNIFTDEVFNKSVFLKLCPSDDDIWFFGALKDTLKLKLNHIKNVQNGYYTTVEGDFCLRHENTNLEENSNILTKEDIQRHLVFNYFNLYEKLNIKPNPKVLEYLESRKKK